jgi:hypothetical protein
MAIVDDRCWSEQIGSGQAKIYSCETNDANYLAVTLDFVWNSSSMQ